MANTYLPISLSLKNRPCLVVGGGKVALRKIDTLLDYDCDLTVIASETDDKIKYYASNNRLKLEQRPYKKSDSEKYGFVIAACDDEDVNRMVYDDCQNAGIPINVVDNPPLCDVIFPAVVRRDCLTVAVSTDGKAPFLSGYLRLILDDIFPKHWNRIARYAAEFRQALKSRWADNPNQKAECIDRFLKADWKEIIKDKSEEEIKIVIEDMLKQSEPESGE
jgi:uroporphyrin-III C-methyltransferase / precorrin-2 dehydrogenase / sirohydrochlorin ferrochelatase